MKSLEGVPSYTERRNTELESELRTVKKEKEELKRNLWLANTELARLRKKSNASELDEQILISFYNDKNITDSILKLGTNLNWEKLYSSNIQCLSIANVHDYKTLARWCLNHFKTLNLKTSNRSRKSPA